MKVTAVFNHAGGVSKTSITRDLGYLLANTHGKKVLLIDGDQSASLSAMLGIARPAVAQSMFSAVENSRVRPLPTPIEVHGMDLIVGSVQYVSLSTKLERSDEPYDLRLREALELGEKKYDYVFVDCPPGVGPITRLAFGAADHLLVPLETSMKSLLAVGGVVEALQAARLRNPGLSIAMFVPSLVDNRTLASGRALEEFRDALPDYAPVSSPLTMRPGVHGRAMFRGSPVPVVEPRGPAAAELGVLAEEFLAAVEGVAA